MNRLAAVLQRAEARLYSATASTLYEPVAVRAAFPLLAGRLEPLVRAQGVSAVEAAAGRPVLDLPVGTGYFTLGWGLGSGGIVVGADIAPGMVRTASSRARAAGAGWFTGIQADVHRLPFASASFGAVMCTNGLQVIPDMHGALSELRRILAPDGRLFATIILFPVGALMPRRASARLPALLKSPPAVLDEFTAAGFEVQAARSSRLALLVEAVLRG